MSDLSGLFFTGTDTGVGKTVVTAAVARLLRRQGHLVQVFKPVATGAVFKDGCWISEDALNLAAAAGITDLAAVTPWVFREPAAPPVAARLEGVTLTIEQLAGAVRAAHRPGSMLLVEGVGGLLCPLTERETVADLAKLLGMALVVVARRSLGTLNHTLLTLEVAERRGLKVAGVVVNETCRPASLAEAANVAELSSRMAVPLLAVIAFREDPLVSSIPELNDVDWWGLGQTAGNITGHK